MIFAADGEVVHRERLAAPPTRTPPWHRSRTSSPTWPNAVRGSRTCWPWSTAAGRDRLRGRARAPRAHRRGGDQDYPIRKTKAGDWNQSRFQRAAEKVWKANAKKIAHEIDRAAERCGAEAVVIADTHARNAVLDEISPSVLEQTVENAKNTDIKDPDLDAELHRLLRLKTHERVMTVAERFDRELANGERAVSGLPETTQALRHGQVETLLLTEDRDSDARLWIGPDPAQVAATADELREEFGITDPEQERADAALVRAAAATDSELVLLPSDGDAPTIPVGAVLRYSTAPDPDLITET